MEEDDQERKGGINVPRQCYIAVPKAVLLDAALSLFPSQPAAEDFRRFARCLDAVLHAEHKVTLDQMCAYYMLPDEEQRGQVSCGNQSSSAAVNSKGSGLFGMAQDSDDDDDRMLFLSTGRLCSAYPRIPPLFLPPEGLPSRPISSAPS